ncbi:hypothetical protein, partial [Bosea sp. WAO]|uniref:hypothetical protein n=1 Tax=Bosea sp. WAO TaxID=406341 RepID=UPI0012ED3348
MNSTFNKLALPPGGRTAKGCVARSARQALLALVECGNWPERARREIESRVPGYAGQHMIAISIEGVAEMLEVFAMSRLPKRWSPKASNRRLDSRRANDNRALSQRSAADMHGRDGQRQLVADTVEKV